MALSAAELKHQIHVALWNEHFQDDKVSGVTSAECDLLTNQVWEKLERAGIVQRLRPS